ncbi:MAG: LON peptidase substrate-binding domain-containing protein, partial [Chloroflexales bacterium]|nr:LON peptidase substrate-binding domain-containing protein [Chloroflexales bacterium]
MTDGLDEGRRAAPPDIPSELALLPLGGIVVYPYAVTPLAIGQAASVQLIDDALRDVPLIGLVALRGGGPRPEQISAEQCFAVGTAAVVHRLLRLPDNTLRVAAQGVARIAIDALVATQPYLRARVRLLDEPPPDTNAARLTRTVLALVGELASAVPTFGADLQAELLADEGPDRLAYLVAASGLPHSTLAERQQLLEIDGATGRLDLVRALLERELDLARRAQPNAPATHAPLLQRRAELLDLPLVQEILAVGRDEGRRRGK